MLFTFLITRLRDSHFSDFHRHVPYRSLSLNSEMSRICPTFYYLGSPRRIPRSGFHARHDSSHTIKRTA